ncbi:hypothetical protein ABMY35_00865 [Pseudoalteromonas sp. BZB3]|uniref:hypothetical protein n=1 Tax=Pseudoalteromonas sp. BZB3 TaxID=3136670 RepID=UPI0032C42393
MTFEKIILTGNLPPPVGGVTVYIRYFIQACNMAMIPVDFFKLIDTLLFRNVNNILYVNSSNSLKRFLYVCVGRLFFKKVFVVKHGGLFDLNNVLVKSSLRLCHGVLCLNNLVQEQLNSIGKVNFLHTTVFSENSRFVQNELIEKSLDTDKCTNLLLYINHSNVLFGEEVYGATFISSVIDEIDFNYKLTVVDLSGDYESIFKRYDNVLYLSQNVDFKKLLSESDIYLRPTSTDGMSVAVLEAGINRVKVLASDVVDRPSFVKTYKFKSEVDFINKLKCLANDDSLPAEPKLTSIEDILRFINNECN